MAQVKFLKAIPESAGWQEMETTDDLTLNSFSGNGANITNLNMSNASSGILNKAFYDSTMAGLGINFSSGVLSSKIKSFEGIGVDSSGMFIDYDGTTLGISGNKLSVIEDYCTSGFATINFIVEDDVVATLPNDEVTFIAGTGMSFTTDPVTKTITFTSTASGGGGTYVAGFGLIESPANKFNINYGNINNWQATQIISGFNGVKLELQATALDTTPILRILNSSSFQVFTVDKDGNLACQDMAADGDIRLGYDETKTIEANGLFVTSLVPSLSNTSNLGDPTHRWEDIFVDDLVGGTKTVSVDNLVDKSASESISGTWSFTGHLNIGDGTSDTLTITSVVDSHILPDANDTRNLGDSTHRWEDIFVDDLIGSVKTVSVNNLLDKSASETITGDWVFQGNIDIGNASSDTLTITSVVDSNILPDSSNSRNLGGTSNRWEDIFVDDIVDTNGSSVATTRLQMIPNTGTSKPTASSSVRGHIYVTEGGTGVADVVEICLKDDSDNYNWVTIQTV